MAVPVLDGRAEDAYGKEETAVLVEDEGFDADAEVDAVRLALVEEVLDEV